MHPQPSACWQTLFIHRPYLLVTFLVSCLIAVPLTSNATSDTSRPEPRKTIRNLMNPDSLSAINFSVIPIPIVTSSPETGVRIGLSLDYFFNAKSKEAKQTKEARGSFVYGQVTYSTLRQLDLMGAWQVFTKGEKWVLRGRAGYSSFKERVWGIGMNTVPENDYWELSYQRTFAESRIYRQLKNNWYGGITINYNNTFNVQYSKPLTPAFNYRDGVTGSSVLGFGPALLLENRDYPFSARKGTYLEAIFQNFIPVGTAPYAYREWIFDFRKFHDFFRSPWNRESAITCRKW